MIPPRIATDRLILRPLAPADAPRMAEYAGDFDVARMLARVPHPYPDGEAERFIAAMTSGDPAETETCFAIDLPGEGLVGAISVVRGDGDPRLGYWIGRPWWGRGFATEAARAVIGWAFGDLGAERLAACAFADNPGSGRVLEKAGFRASHACEDHCLARGARVATMEYVLDADSLRTNP